LLIEGSNVRKHNANQLKKNLSENESLIKELSVKELKSVDNITE